MTDFIEDQGPTWDTTYLLGWYDETGSSYLTTWQGDLPMIHVVVTGCSGLDMPLWDAPVPMNAKMLAVPAGEVPQDYARKMGGYHAFGWHMPVKRREPNPIIVGSRLPPDRLPS